MAFEDSEVDGTVVERFQRIMETVPPEHLAIVDDQEALSYGELDRRSNVLAAWLVATIGAGSIAAGAQPVALILPHDATSIVGLLGVIKAGHFYVALDEAQGETTIQNILKDFSPPVLVTAGALQAFVGRVLGENSPTQILLLDRVPVYEPEQVASLLAPVRLSAQSYCAMLYTSGSTGAPRGTIRTHGLHVKVGHFIFHAFDVQPNDRLSHFISCAHGGSVNAIFGGLLNGATLYIRNLREMSPLALYDWLQRNQITHLLLFPSFARTFAEAAAGYPPLIALRSLTMGGEAVHVLTVKNMRKLLTPQCTIANILGSTEVGNISLFPIKDDTVWSGDTVPTGYPAPFTEILILDEEGESVVPSTVGQIAVRSRYLAAGYWNQPKVTAAKFLTDVNDTTYRIYLSGDMGYLTRDGVLEFLGRQDFMVKVRGYRVELEAVEAALLSLPSVLDAVVIAQNSATEGSRLVAYIVPQESSGFILSELRAQLAAKIPEYMVPAAFVVMETLPHTIAGKIDRKALPPPGNERPATLSALYTSPRNETETRLCAIWEEFLEIRPVGVDDDFFELGGDSLLAMRMGVIVEREWQQDVSAAFMERATVASLAHFLQGGLNANAQTQAGPSQNVAAMETAATRRGPFSTLVQRLRTLVGN